MRRVRRHPGSPDDPARPAASSAAALLDVAPDPASTQRAAAIARASASGPRARSASSAATRTATSASTRPDGRTVLRSPTAGGAARVSRRRTPRSCIAGSRPRSRTCAGGSARRRPAARGRRRRRRRPVRLLTYVEGPLTDRRHLSPGRRRPRPALGPASAALAGFDHPASTASSSGTSARPARSSAVCSADRRPRPSRARGRLHRAAPTERLARRCPSGCACRRSTATSPTTTSGHDDAGGLRADGIIDFGDLMLVARRRHRRHRLVRAAPRARRPVRRARGRARVPRDRPARRRRRRRPLAAGSVARCDPRSERRAPGRARPRQRVVTEPLEGEWRILHTARTVVPTSLGGSDPHGARHGSCTAPRRRSPRSPVPAVLRRRRPGPSSTCRSRVPSCTRDASSRRGIEREIEAGRRRSGCDARWAEARLTRTVLDSPGAPATYASGVDLLLPAGTTATSPFDARGRGRRLHGRASRATRIPHRVGPAAVGRVGRRGGARRRRRHGRRRSPSTSRCASTRTSPRPRSRRRTPRAAGWPQPRPVAPFWRRRRGPRDDDVDGSRRAARRARHRAGALLRRPMRIERGWRQYLVDTTGRTYVDMVNNVAAIGHGHLRLADAVEQQLRTFNTNSRFHYAPSPSSASGSRPSRPRGSTPCSS